MPGPLAWERCVFEFCCGAGGVSCFGEPRSGRGGGWVFAWVDAHDWGDLRRCVSGEPIFAEPEFCDVGSPGYVVRGADDFLDRGVAACRQSADGGVAGADGVDRGHGAGESVALGVSEVASAIGVAGERRFARGGRGDVLAGARGQLSREILKEDRLPHPPPIFSKNVILKVFHALSLQECDSKCFTSKRSLVVWPSACKLLKLSCLRRLRVLLDTRLKKKKGFSRVRDCIVSASRKKHLFVSAPRIPRTNGFPAELRD